MQEIMGRTSEVVTFLRFDGMIYYNAMSLQNYRVSFSPKAKSSSLSRSRLSESKSFEATFFNFPPHRGVCGCISSSNLFKFWIKLLAGPASSKLLSRSNSFFALSVGIVGWKGWTLLTVVFVCTLLSFRYEATSTGWTCF